MQKNLADALLWFSELKLRAAYEIDQIIHPSNRKPSSDQHSELTEAANLEDAFEDGTRVSNVSQEATVPNSIPVQEVQNSDTVDEDKGKGWRINMFCTISVLICSSDGKRKRHSAYLRATCPACFGSSEPGPARFGVNVQINISILTIISSVLVQIDACFAQKNMDSRWDPPMTHIETKFIPESEINEMRAFVESLQAGSKHTTARKTNSRKRKHQDQAEDEDEDTIEEGLEVPNSVLDKCKSSYTAADEGRKKADASRFQSTGLVALTCRHDRPLFVCDMTTPGERQFYVVALINKLLQHIPEHTHIGILYDISCQIHRSANKHGFFGPELDRMFFGVSVFHAYGHHWACQLIYHPRKRKGFGLTDGEGCERLWASLKKLIPWLRVVGVSHV